MNAEEASSVHLRDRACDKDRGEESRVPWAGGYDSPCLGQHLKVPGSYLKKLARVELKFTFQFPKHSVECHGPLVLKGNTLPKTEGREGGRTD